MNAQKSAYVPYPEPPEGKTFTRSRSFVDLGIIGGASSLFVMLLAFALIIYTLKEPATVNRPKTPATAHPIGKVATPTVPTPTPTSPPTPAPTPISPFPSSLPQELTVLKNHDRFLLQGNPQLPEVALTFDDGPGPVYTPQILAILHRSGIQATFFCVGSQVQLYPELVRQELSDGHIIGNHTWSHPDMPLLSGPSLIWQITTARDSIKRATGISPIYFRPPYGAISANTLKYINMFGLTTILWNTDPRDWARPGVNAIVRTVLREAGNGGIILLHDGGGDRSQTVAALPIIIQRFQQMGYRFVTIPQLLKDLHVQPPQNNNRPASPPKSPAWQREQQMLHNRHANDY